MILNRKAKYLYSLLKIYEAGIHLKGVEVVAIREGQAQLVDSYVEFSGGEAWLKNFQIQCKPSAFLETDPLRPKKLLMHKKEIQSLQKEVAQKGLTVIPLKVYFNERGKIKVELSLAKGKSNYDKRATLKEKAIKRDME